MRKVITYLGVLVVTLLITNLNVNALTINEDLKLTEDLNQYVEVNDGSVVTIDLNGHNIVAARNGVIKVTNNSKVTIKGNGIIQSTNSNAIVVTSGSTVVLESGTIKSQEFGVFVANDSTFTMNGGTIETVDNCGVGGNGSNNDSYKNYTININGGVINGNITSNGYVSCGIYHPNKGTVNINGGTINSSNGAGIVQRAGTLNITGGTINAKGSTTGKVGDSRVVVSASAVVIDKEANYPEVATMSTKISKDAILNGTSKDIETIGKDINIQLIGGVYTEKPADEQIPDGYQAYKVIDGNNENKYVVVKESELKHVVSQETVNKTDLNQTDVSLIEQSVKNKYNLVSFYDINYMTVTPSSDVVGMTTEPREYVDVTVGVPQNLPAVKEGYTRIYHIIRVHNGEVTIIDDVTDNSNGTITFKTNKFSSYALAYNDVVKTTEKSPKTLDNISLYIITLISAVSILLIRKIYLKNKYNN